MPKHKKESKSKAVAGSSSALPKPIDIENIRYNVRSIIEPYTPKKIYLHHDQNVLAKVRPIEAGTSFGSGIIQFTIAIKGSDLESRGPDQEPLRLIGKVPPPANWCFDDAPKAFYREKVIYELVIPTIKRWLGRDDRLEKYDLFAKYYGSSIYTDAEQKVINTNAIIYLEELSHGFWTPPHPHDGLNAADTRYVLEKMANFHVYSMMYIKENFDHFHKDLIPFLQDDIRKIIDVKNIDKIIDGLALCYEIDKNQVKRSFANFLKYSLEKDTFRSKAYVSIVHREFWLKNIFLKRDRNGQIVDFRMIDLQNFAYDSVAIDVLYFLYSSVDVDVLWGSFTELCNHYFKHFRLAAADFGYDDDEFNYSTFARELERSATFVVAPRILSTIQFIYAKDDLKDRMEPYTDEDFYIKPDKVNLEPLKKKVNFLIRHFNHNKWI